MDNLNNNLSLNKYAFSMRFVAIKVDLQTYIKIEHCLFRFFLIVRAPRFADLFF